jgi:hypothetical protein
MSIWRGPPIRRHDDVRISAIRVAFVVSLLVHAVALWTYLPRMRLLTPTDAAEGESGSPLAVMLAQPQNQPGSTPPSSPPPEPVVALQSPTRSTPPPQAVARRPSTPSVMTVPRQSPNLPALPEAPPERAPAPPQPVAATDLAAYIEARRRARGESPSASQQSSSKSSDDENERQNRIIAANLGMNAQPSFGKDAQNGGGVFQIKTLEFTYAEFYFYGWNKDISRKSKQVIEVRKGDNSDIRIAVVRKMIDIVREHETGDFVWESHRTGRQLTLSARARDTAELEAFMMQEFASDFRSPP